MRARTDLAIELDEELSGALGVEKSASSDGDINVTRIRITSHEGEKAMRRRKGSYVTVEFPQLYKITNYSGLKNALIKELKDLLPEGPDRVLVVGLGNTDITPDAVGPLTAGKILATRHISGQFADGIGLKGLKSVSVLSPGVLGQTGIESVELIKGAVQAVKPAAVIIIDSLASRSTERLFRTVQLSDAGISPGSGVKNSRREINSETLGVPVIAMGVPTVMDAEALAYELTGRETEKSSGMFVTPKEVDMLCGRISDILAAALNVFLQPDIDEDIVAGLV